MFVEANAISSREMHQAGAKWPHFVCTLSNRRIRLDRVYFVFDSFEP